VARRNMLLDWLLCVVRGAGGAPWGVKDAGKMGFCAGFALIWRYRGSRLSRCAPMCIGRGIGTGYRLLGTDPYFMSLAISATAWSVFLSIFRTYQLARMTRAGGWDSAWEMISWSLGLAAGLPK